MVHVFANYKHDFGMQLESLYLEKDGSRIHLSKEDWNEIQAVMNGKRKRAQTEIKEGAYYPQEMILFN